MVKIKVGARSVAPHIVTFAKKQTARGAKTLLLRSSPLRLPSTPLRGSSRATTATPTRIFHDAAAIHDQPPLSRPEFVKVRVCIPPRCIRLSAFTDGCFNMQPDPMRDWLLLKDQYLAALYAAEAPRGATFGRLGSTESADRFLCYKCQAVQGEWRCTCCWGGHLLCKSCCLDQHQLNPFHRIEHWAPAGHFEPAQLSDLGLKIWLSPRGPGCRCHGSGQPEKEDDDLPEWDTEEEDDDEDSSAARWDTHFRSRQSPGKAMIVVDVTGVHTLPVLFCTCDGSPPHDMQMLRMGLYPSTQKAIRTAFTFQVLDLFLLENLECKTPASSFYARLRRMTDPVFPHRVPVSVGTTANDSQADL